MLTLHGMAVFSLLVLWRRHLLDRGDDQALVRAGRAACGTCRIAAAADKGLIRLEEPAQRTGRIIAAPRAAGIGASRSLRRVAAIVRFLITERAVSRRSGNWSSCP